jgi:hypothetical protein
MNTREAAGAGVDSTKGLPLGEIRGLTKLVKITEDVRRYAKEQGISEEAAIQEGLEQKATEFAKSGAKIYVNG